MSCFFTNPACDLARSLEDYCETFLELERTSSKWRILETTFTDVLIAAFAHQNLATIHVDSSVEAQTGADIELLVLGKHHQSVVYVIQAKRSEFSSAGSSNYSFKHIFHKPKKATRHQVEQLQHYCKTMNTVACRTGCFDAFHVPLYAFYHGESAARNLGCSGVMVAGIRKVLGELNSPKRRNLTCKFHQEFAVCFHRLFCDCLGGGNLISNARQFAKNTQIGSTLDQSSVASELAESWLNFELEQDGPPAANFRALIDLRV